MESSGHLPSEREALQQARDILSVASFAAPDGKKHFLLTRASDLIAGVVESLSLRLGDSAKEIQVEGPFAAILHSEFFMARGTWAEDSVLNPAAELPLLIFHWERIKQINHTVHGSSFGVNFIDTAIDSVWEAQGAAGTLGYLDRIWDGCWIYSATTYARLRWSVQRAVLLGLSHSEFGHFETQLRSAEADWHPPGLLQLFEAGGRHLIEVSSNLDDHLDLAFDVLDTVESDLATARDSADTFPLGLSSAAASSTSWRARASRPRPTTRRPPPHGAGSMPSTRLVSTDPGTT